MISNQGFCEEFITLYANEENIEKPVFVSADNTCALATDGTKFVGVLKNCRNGIGSVQVKGYISLPYSGNAPTFGETSLSADGLGGVKTDVGGKNVIVVSVDTVNKSVAFII